MNTVSGVYAFFCVLNGDDAGKVSDTINSGRHEPCFPSCLENFYVPMIVPYLTHDVFGGYDGDKSFFYSTTIEGKGVHCDG